ncbi:hypothetical protein ACIHEI_17345 [Kitasatospora sp. NPDC051984]|uniref:hypothetical protein n=1 Tax=Kitasatospora sp. NPDC051984 TaxID=3364059 RepID=UPI0037C56851
MAQERKPNAGGRLSVRANAVGLLMTLLLTAVGVGILVTGAARLTELSDARRRPEVPMTVSSCSTVRTLRLATTTCHGTVPAGPAQLTDAPRRFAEGAVVNVHCMNNGTCTTAAFRDWAGRTALVGLGLLACGAGLTGLLRRGIRLFAPTHDAFLRDPRLTRFAQAYCLVTGLIAAGGYLGHLLT